MKWLREMLYGPDPREDFGPGPTASAKAKEPEAPKDDGMGEIVDKFYDERETLFEAYEPKGPAFKIVQTDEGNYVIQRRMVEKSYDPFVWGFSGMEIRRSPKGRPFYGFQTAAHWGDPSPKEYYDVVKNPSRPTKSGSYADLIFNVFEDAEAYLKRMTASPQEKEVGYDFPPLKRVKAKPTIREARKEG